MIAQDFFEEYKNANEKEKCAAKHVVRKYVPYAEKLTMADKIIENSMYAKIGGAKTFKPDTTVRYFLFIMAIIEAYTDIRFSDDGKNGQQNLESFDLFESNGATEVFTKVIGDDIGRLTTVLQMKVDDVTDMERSLVPFLDTKIQAWSLSMDAVSKAIQEKVENNE